MILNYNQFIKEKYEFENFTMDDMEMVKELYKEGMESPKEISKEMDLPIETINQILYSLRKRGDID